MADRILLILLFFDGRDICTQNLLLLLSLPDLQFCLFNLSLNISHSLVVLNRCQLSLLVQLIEFSLLIISPQVKLAYFRTSLRKLHRSFELHLSDNEFAVTQLADLSFEFHTVRIDASSREHSLFIETVLAVTDTTELAEVHLGLFLKDEIVTTLAGSKLGLLSVWLVQEKDRVFLTDRDLVLADSHLSLAAL